MLLLLNQPVLWQKLLLVLVHSLHAWGHPARHLLHLVRRWHAWQLERACAICRSQLLLLVALRRLLLLARIQYILYYGLTR